MHAVMGGGRLIAGRYRLGAPIGRGAMGIVWLGHDELLAREVAVKEVQISAQATPAEAETLYQRTLREARAAARLSHPGAVTVFDVVEENGSPWIVMELVKGRSLDRLIAEDGPLPPRQAAELGTNLLGALDSAHAAGVLHRDVKPSNVLIAGDGRAVLTDFGIATFAGDPGQTQSGMVVGTPGFTAPERVHGGAAAPTSDLWSLGATLYAAVEGRGPFDRAGGADAITLGVANEDAPTAPSAGALGPVIDALLRRDPGARPDAATAARLLAEAAGVAPAAGPTLPAILDPPVFAQLSVPAPPDPAADMSAVAALNAVTDLNATPDVSLIADPGAGASGPLIASLEDGARVGTASLGAAASVGSVAADQSAVSLAGRQTGNGYSSPVLWQPLKGPSAEVGGHARALGDPAGGSDGAGSDGAGSDGAGSGRFRRGGQARPAPGRWRLPLAGAGIAVIVAAAVVGWYLFSGSPTTQALQNTTAPGNAVRDSSGPANGVSGAGANPSGSAPPAGGTAPSVSLNGQPPGNPSPAMLSSPSSSLSASSSPSPSASPSPSPSSTRPVLPPGYVWHRFTAAVMGTAAGFEIGMPSSWQQSVTALSAHLNQVASNFHLTVNLAPWKFAGPLSQAEYLQRVAARTDQGYKPLLIGLIGFRAVGGFTAAPAADLKFSWIKPSTGSVTELIILVTLGTKAGPQPYAFTLLAPSATFGSASNVLHTAMPTFRPLPGA